MTKATDHWTIERCEANGDHEQVKGSHFCRCTHVMYDSEQPGAERMPEIRTVPRSAQEMTLQQYLEQLPASHRVRREYHDLIKKAAEEIHMIEVQRDEARASAKAIVQDLIDESSAQDLGCWLMGPRQFKLAILARLENWK